MIDLVSPLYNHVSWASPSGTILMGGSILKGSSGRTSEKIDESGTTSYGFDLEYSTE